MAADEVSIFNLALESVGTEADVSATTESSREAEVCRLWFGPVRDLVLHAAPWNSAKAYARLALLAERDDTIDWTSTDPAPGYRYMHTAPADMLRPRYLSTYERFEMGTSGSSRVIHSQTQSPILTYTKLFPQTQLWEHDLYMAVAMGLAAMICTPLTGKTKRTEQLETRANILLLKAQAANANDQSFQLETMPDWLAARGSAYGAPPIRFYHPNGPLIAVSEAAGVS